MHVHEESREFLGPIFTKRTNALQHYVQVCCTGFYQNRTINIQSIYRYLFATFSKGMPLPRRFSRNKKLPNRSFGLSAVKNLFASEKMQYKGLKFYLHPSL
jgi:hypothetical protein